MNARRLTFRAWATVALVAAVVCGAATSPAASAAEGAGAKQAKCKGPASLGGYFQLAQNRKLSLKRVGCDAAGKAVKRFPKFCAEAYAAQGACKIRSGGKWRCTSTIVGPLEKGAPSKEACARRKARITFTVTYFPPREPATVPPPVARKGPWNDAGNCIDTSKPGTLIPPPAQPAGNYEIHAMKGVGTARATSLQSSLVGHSVSPLLHAGLGSEPRNNPARIPIFLTKGDFDADGSDGVKQHTCANTSVDALIVRTNLPASEVASTGAHELYHAYSAGVRYSGLDPWYEEASAAWFEGKSGYPEPSLWDINLQYPYRPADMTQGTYHYAMSRFVQFLDSRGLIGPAGGSWPLQREVINGYSSPGATQALVAALVARGTSFGEQLAAFWGDRILETPLHGPQLQPTNANANMIEIEPGTTDLPAPTKPLHTKFFNFTLADNVKRVEFVFEPGDGYFWGAVEANRSQRFLAGESVTFCVGGGDEDDLEWPIRFPVTYTNGDLTNAITGRITVHAQADAEQCTSPSLNRACRVLTNGNVSSIIGPGFFPFASGSADGSTQFWICFYHSDGGGEASLNLARFKESARQVRARVKEQIRQLGLRSVSVGDVGGFGSLESEEGPVDLVVMAIGKEIAFLMVGPPSEARTLRLARAIAGQT